LPKIFIYFGYFGIKLKKLVYNIIFYLQTTNTDFTFKRHTDFTFNSPNRHTHAIMSSREQKDYKKLLKEGQVEYYHGLVNYVEMTPSDLSKLNYSGTVALINRFTSLGIWKFNQLLMFLRHLEFLSKGEAEFYKTETMPSKYELLVLKALQEKRLLGEKGPITLQEIEEAKEEEKAKLAREKARIEAEKAHQEFLRTESEEDKKERIKREEEEEKEYYRKIERELEIQDQNDAEDYLEQVAREKEEALEKAKQDAIDKAKQDAIDEATELFWKARREAVAKERAEKKALIVAEMREEVERAISDVRCLFRAEKDEANHLIELDCVMSDAFRVSATNLGNPVVQQTWFGLLSSWF